MILDYISSAASTFIAMYQIFEGTLSAFKTVFKSRFMAWFTIFTMTIFRFDAFLTLFTIPHIICPIMTGTTLTTMTPTFFGTLVTFYTMFIVRRGTFYTFFTMAVTWIINFATMLTVFVPIIRFQAFLAWFTPFMFF